MAQPALSLANLQAALSQNNTKIKEWVGTQIGNIDLFSIEWVQALPTTNISTSTIYMIKNTQTGAGENSYIEYVYNSTLSAWEILGELHAEVDLSGYYDKTEIDNLLKSYYTKAELDSKFNDYYTKTESDATLTNYYKKTEVDTTLADYAKKTDVAKDLEPYAKSADVEATYAKKTEVEETYAKKANVEETYAKKTDVEDTYAKKTDVATTLEAYAKSADVATTLEAYAKTDEVAAGYYNKTQIDEKVDALTVSNYTSQEITDMVNGVWSE